MNTYQTARVPMQENSKRQLYLATSDLINNQPVPVARIILKHYCLYGVAYWFYNPVFD